jgi:hypothetical protein
MHLVLIILLALHLQAWSPALSLSTSETIRGATLTAVATAPEGAEVALQPPVGVSAELLDRQGQTVRWQLTVASTAPLDRTPRQVALLIDGQVVDTQPLRIWTEEVRRFDVWLPVVRGDSRKEITSVRRILIFCNAL